MRRLLKHVTQKLSVRLSLMVVLSVAVLLTAAMTLMLYFARKGVRQEALEKAQMTLESTMQQIDNILLSVEQTAGNIYWNMLTQIDHPEKMEDYCLRILEANPYVTGCAIALEPYYYNDHDKYFMAYYRRQSKQGRFTPQSPVLKTETFGTGPYTEQEWYAIPMKEGKPDWIGPLKDTDAEGEAITSFCIPIYNHKGDRIGMLGTDVALSLLTRFIHSAKPSPNSYCTLLGRDGSYIVHPDTSKLQHTSVMKEGVDQTVIEAAKSMMAGETGHKEFRQNGKHYYVFYKPFERADVPGRANNDMGWSVGIIYPEDDILGDYNRLLYTLLAVDIIGLILLLLLCRAIIRRQLLPLKLLTSSAQRIAEGHFDETIPDSRQSDEIGRLQDHFQKMQQSLATHMGQLKQLNDTLHQRGESLNEAYGKAQEADRLKTAFLHNMSNQMQEPSEAIVKSVSRLNDTTKSLTPEEADRLAEEIQQQGETITELLNNLLTTSQKIES